MGARMSGRRFLLAAAAAAALCAPCLQGASAAGPQSPLKQARGGVPAHGIECAAGLVAALREPDRAACVTPRTAELLGWPEAAPPPRNPAVPWYEPRPGGHDAAAAAVNAFAFDFYRQVSAGGGNVVFSPLGVHAALSALYEGASGEAAAQMERALGISPDARDRRAAAAALLSSAVAQLGADVDVANVFWAADGRPPAPGYAETVRRAYSVDVKEADLGDPGGAAAAISSWTKAATRGKIADVLDERDVAPQAPLAVTSAASFTGPWEREHPVARTAEGDFMAPGGPIRADFMHTGTRLAYSEAGPARAATITYDRDRLRMLAVLPSGDGGMDELEGALSPSLLSKLSNRRQDVAMDLVLPLFKVDATYDLAPPLAALGAARAFDPGRPGLDGVLAGAPVHAGTAVHRASVDVTEAGANAASVFPVWVPPPDVPPREPPFVADRPFLFFILDDETGAVLFMGRVSDPA